MRNKPTAALAAVCICTLLTVSPFFVFAQLPGLKDSIYSETLKEGRVLQVQLPKEYKAGSQDKYPVLYLTDGEWNAGLMAEVQAWSRQWGFTPPIIMVGIANSYPGGNNQRGRDLTPTGKNGAGGGPAFLSFIKNELIPYINKTYPSNGSNILWGHSLGGMFVLYTLFKEPQLFDAYIAADPSLWWDNGYMLRLADSSLPTLKGVKSLFVTGRTRSPWHEMRIDSLEMLLKEKAPAGLQWKTVAYPDETHVSQQYKSAYDGLKYTLAPAFKGDRIRINPMAGIVAANKPFTISCYNILSDKNMRYTMDGSEPQLSSTIFGAENVLTSKGAATLHIKSFFADSAKNRSLTVKFNSGKPLSPVSKPAGIASGSFNYSCYTDTSKVKALGAGLITPDMNFSQLVKDTCYFTELSGWLQTEKAGYYIFEMVGEAGAKLFLGSQLLLEVAPGDEYSSFMVPLEKGFYPIRFTYSHRRNGNDFYFSYVLPGATDDVSVPFSLLYSKP